MIELVWLSPARGRGMRGFAPWVRELDGRNGVYLIRDGGSGEVLYVGESYRRRLYDTLTRHFQSWDGWGSGPTYHRDDVEVAILLVDAPEEVARLQYELIQHFNPPDNQQDGRSIFMHARLGAELEPGRDDDEDYASSSAGDGEEVPF